MGLSRIFGHKQDLSVSRKRRALGFAINIFTLGGLVIGNVFLGLTSGRTIGGIIAGYKYKRHGKAMIHLLLAKILSTALYIFTLSAFYWLDIYTMDRRNGTFAEKWSNNTKLHHR